MKRYQVYLDPHSVGILDEAVEGSIFSRSQFLRELVDAASTRCRNLLAVFKPPRVRDYSVWDKMIGSIKVKGRKSINLSENVDEIYYR